MAESSLQRVLRSEELPAADPRIDDASPARIRREAKASTADVLPTRQVRVGRSELLLARLPAGEVVAFGAHCPHQGTPLNNATLYEGHIRCPQHNFVYDPHSGQNILPTRDHRPEALQRLKPGYLPTHRVEERDGWIWVATQPNPPPAPRRDPLEFPLRRPGVAAGGSPARTRSRPALHPDESLRFVLQPADVGEAAQKHDKEGPIEHPRELLTVQVGEQFDVVLPTTPLPGYIWKVETTGEAVVPLGQTYEEGGQVRGRVRLEARAAGEAEVRCAYARFWGDQVEEIRTFAVHIDEGGGHG